MMPAQYLCRTKGSLGSVVLGLGIGLITHIHEGNNILPKQILNNICKKETDVSFCNTSKGMASIQHALPFFALSIAFFTSNIEM